MAEWSKAALGLDQDQDSDQTGTTCTAVNGGLLQAISAHNGRVHLLSFSKPRFDMMTKTGVLLRAALLLFAQAFLLSCSHPTEKEIQTEFAEFVRERDSCKDASDCALVNTGCPLGCGTAVRRENADVVKAKAHHLISAWESAGNRCVYDCMQPEMTCEAGRCTAVTAH